MKDTWYTKSLLVVGVYGKLVAVVMILTPSLLDIARTGLLGFFEWAVGWRGILCMLTGMGIGLASMLIDRKLK